MKFSLENSQGYLIRGYHEGRVEIAGTGQQGLDSGQPDIQIFTTSLILTPASIFAEWEPVSPDQINSDHIRQVLATNPELILLGTGKTLVFPEPAIVQECLTLGIGMDVMDTGAACRTYNVLAAEGRKVAAALLMI